MKKYKKIRLDEQQILDALSDYIYNCDGDDLCALAEQIFGGKCYNLHKKDDTNFDFEFTPNANYWGAFDEEDK